MDQICPDILRFLRRNELELSTIFLHRWFILSFQREFSLSDVLFLLNKNIYLFRVLKFGKLVGFVQH